MINILVSVRRPFSGLILDNKKPLELRKNKPNTGTDTNIVLWLYESGKYGARAIIGKCRYFGHIEVWGTTPDMAVEWASIQAHVDKNELVKYVPCCAWLVGKPVRLPAAVPLSAIGMTRPPQNWQYITPEQAAILEQAACRECVPTAERDCPNCKHHDLLTKQYPCRECYLHDDQRLWEPRKEGE